MPMPSVEMLLEIGIALSIEKDGDKLFETILNAAMDITACDGGTLYIVKGHELHFKILITKSLGLRQGLDGAPVNLPPVSLSPRNVSSRAVLDKAPINIASVYTSDAFDFSGTKRYDAMTGYQSVSMLAVPMEDEEGDVIGVMQLINAKDENGAIIPFDPSLERVIYALASQAAICLINRNYASEMTELLDSVVRGMSAAIDARSSYNANHTRNMVIYAERFVEWLNRNKESFHFDDIRRRQFIMSVWLHDIGKLVVPLEVMDKETRLGPKIDVIRSRFRLFALQNENNYLRNKIGAEEYQSRADEIEHMCAIVETANSAGYLQDDIYAEVCALGEKRLEGPDGVTDALAEDERVCLQIRRGTLTDEERTLMEKHVLMTRRILSEMNFPKHFIDVPRFASSHHEHLNGRGYPDKKTGEDIPADVRIITILDIYEALTARDRPYRPSMPREKAFAILEDMAAQGQVDSELLALFKESGVWEEGSAVS